MVKHASLLVKLLLSLIVASFINWFQNTKLKNIQKVSAAGINLLLCFSVN
jgi:hypothetical protein